MDEITEKFEYMIEKCPEKIIEFVKKIYEYEPHMIKHMLETFEDEGHITNKRKYDELINKVKWANGNGKGERWAADDIKKMSKIDFSNVEYTEFDYAYLVNMLYAKCCKDFSDMSLFVKLAKCLLEDKDEETKVYRGHNHKNKYKQHGEQNSYRSDYRNEYRNHGDFDEESRRGRYRNRNESDYYDNRYEDRNSYSNYENRNSFFRQD